MMKRLARRRSTMFILMIAQMKRKLSQRKMKVSQLATDDVLTQ